MRRFPFASLVALALPLALTGCGGSSAPEATVEPASAPDSVAGSEAPAVEVNRELQGKVRINGSSTVYPISEAAASQFNQRYPNVSVNVGIKGTGGGFELFTKGETDISDASRPIKAAEMERAAENDIRFIELPVAYDGLTIVVHKDNDWVDRLTVEEVKQIFTADGGAKKWSDVRDGWPDETIQIFSPGTDSGTFDYFKEVVAGKTGSMRDDMSTSEDDNVLVTGVSGSPDAIGFFGYAYYDENKEKLRAVPVVNSDGDAVTPSAQTIEDGTYEPFSRPLFIYVNADAIRRPEVKQFVSFYLDNAPELAAETKYVALPTEVYEHARGNARSRKAGTHYVAADGTKRGGAVTDVFTEANRNDGS